MSDGYYDESYPPSLWLGPNPTGVTAGSPGAFVPANSNVPNDLAELQSMGALGNTTAWTTGQYVVLEDGSHAYWNGTAWVAGEAPVAEEPPPLDEPEGDEPEQEFTAIPVDRSDMPDTTEDEST